MAKVERRREKLITQKLIDEVIPLADRALIISEAKSPLKVKMTPTGHLSYGVWMRFGGKPNAVWRTIRETKLSAARATAEAWEEASHDRRDPEQERKEQLAKQAKQQAQTFALVFDEYAKAKLNHQRRGEKTKYEIIGRPADRPSAIWKDLKSKSIHSISKADVIKHVNAFTERKKFYQARNVFVSLKTFFKWAEKNGRIDVSPIKETNVTDLIPKGKIKERKRTLNDDEIFAFWRATERMNYPRKQALQLILITGARLSDILQAKWSEFHLETRWLNIPAERMKMDEPYNVYLNDDAMSILASIPRGKAGDYVFSASDGKTHISLNDPKPARKLRKKVIRTLKAIKRVRGEYYKDIDWQPFTNHDLRRTMRTRITKLRVPYEVAESMIAHKKKGLDAVYNQHEYEDEKREAMITWGGHLKSITSRTLAADVVPIRSAQAA